MSMVTSRELHEAPNRTLRATNKGPVFITTRGTVTHVLMTKETFDQLTLDGGQVTRKASESKKPPSI